MPPRGNAAFASCTLQTTLPSSDGERATHPERNEEAKRQNSGTALRIRGIAG